MVRLRATLHAVPSRVWTSVAGLAVLASLSLAVVLGAGLQVWRGAVGSPANAPAVALSHVPGSGVVTVPTTPAHRPRAGGHPTPSLTGGPPTAAATTRRGGAPAGPAKGSPGRTTPGSPGNGAGRLAPPTTTPPTAAREVVALDGLLADLHGRTRNAAIGVLSGLALRPALAWSVGGRVEGEGRAALLAIVRAHASHGVMVRLAAALRDADASARGGDAGARKAPRTQPSTGHGEADRHGSGAGGASRGNGHGEGHGHQHGRD